MMHVYRRFEVTSQLQYVATSDPFAETVPQVLKVAILVERSAAG